MKNQPTPRRDDQRRAKALRIAEINGSKDTAFKIMKRISRSAAAREEYAQKRDAS